MLKIKDLVDKDTGKTNPSAGKRGSQGSAAGSPGKRGSRRGSAGGRKRGSGNAADTEKSPEPSARDKAGISADNAF